MSMPRRSRRCRRAERAYPSHDRRQRLRESHRRTIATGNAEGITRVVEAARVRLDDIRARRPGIAECVADYSMIAIDPMRLKRTYSSREVAAMTGSDGAPAAAVGRRRPAVAGDSVAPDRGRRIYRTPLYANRAVRAARAGGSASARLHDPAAARDRARAEGAVRRAAVRRDRRRRACSC